MCAHRDDGRATSAGRTGKLRNEDAAVAVGQLEIDENHVEPLRGRDRDCLGTRPRDADRVAAVREQHLHQIGVCRVILDQQAVHVRRRRARAEG